MRVLVVEDAPRNQERFQKLYPDCVIAADWRTALRTLFGHEGDPKFDLVCLDWNLEGYSTGPLDHLNNGLEIARRIAREGERQGVQVGKFFCHSTDRTKADEMTALLQSAGYEAVTLSLDSLERLPL